eukprot:629826-Pyramimonas_sp.AAC.1
MARETQAGGWWKVRGSPAYVKPALGSRPGTILATDIFNVGFAPIVKYIDQQMQQDGLALHGHHCPLSSTSPLRKTLRVLGP